MLSEDQNPGQKLGSLRVVKVPATFLQELLKFIEDELPTWRDRSDRPKETSEPRLTAQLCAHLNGAARRLPGWDILQFRREEPDEVSQSRAIDLAIAPCDATIWVEGRRVVEFDTLIPIECKRLPTPQGTKRDSREYVFNQYSTTGGMQRFKMGQHGANHPLAAMIGYIQEESCSVWSTRIADWINGLCKSKQQGWTKADHLSKKSADPTNKVMVLASNHARPPPLENIKLHHLWIEMI